MPGQVAANYAVGKQGDAPSLKLAQGAHLDMLSQAAAQSSGAVPFSPTTSSLQNKLPMLSFILAMALFVPARWS